MLRFSRLRLNGFKSFVDPTDLVIASGLTGVVGPNGCGKSNLLEALRWVMGENRPTAMRGAGMEDVIFAGAATRPARNFAEVSLSIDNTERLAPSGFNDADTLDITRRITRDAGSAYKAGVKDVRARDVQMLFADASTGAHSPALVRQGQIAELINARPKARRRILEEAAGISGLYQRRHEAELKLNGAETNLARVDDVIEQLAAQLATLARQARQAARYRAIGEDLRRAEGLLLLRHRIEAAEAREAAQATLREAMTAAAAAERGVLQADRARETAEAALPPLREEEAIAAAVLQRIEVELAGLSDEEERAQDRIDRLCGQIAQLDHDIAREAELNRDAGETIRQLEWEARKIEQASEGQEERLDAARQDAERTAQALEVSETKLTESTEDSARLAARYQSAQRLRDEAEKTLARHRDEAAKARATEADARAALEAAQVDADAARDAQATATQAAEGAEKASVQADAARATAAGQEAEARAARASAEGEASALGAEVGALQRLVERDSGKGDRILDKITVAPGFEAAFGAALADDLTAPETDGATGWALLPAYATPPALPAGAQPLAPHVTAPRALARRLTQVGICAAEDGPKLQASLQPGQRLVSQDGDLWRWDGLRAGHGDAPSATALRLQQVNKLAALKTDLDAAQQTASTARTAHEAAQAELKAAGEADAAARAARRTADQAVAEAGRTLSRAESAVSLSETRRDGAALSLERHEAEAEAANARLQEAHDALSELPDMEEARAATEAARQLVEDARKSMMAARQTAEDLRRAGTARLRRRQEITKESSGWRERLSNAEQRAGELASRKTTAEAELAEARALPATLGERRERLAASREEADTRRKVASDALALGETTYRDADLAAREAARAASTAREARAASEARAEAADGILAERDAAIAEAREGQTVDELAAGLEADLANLPDSAALDEQISRLRRSRDTLGAVNLRAEEDAVAVQEEHDALVREKADLEGAIATLRGGINALNKEGRERLLTAFDQVNANFGTLFTHLFGGGEARLVLVESDDPLEAGLEIMCQPPGKKLSVLSLLSGGEQTLTAMALIFAVFLSNPAPICVLDEVDAPLDDANVTRFCDLLDEMTRRTDTRFLIITHHAITMSRMDRLFGVTMQEQGVSQLVSVDLKRAEALVA